MDTDLSRKATAARVAESIDDRVAKGDAAARERLWVLAIARVCSSFADCALGVDARDAALMLLSLETARRRAVRHRDVTIAAMEACGEMFDQWSEKYGWRRRGTIALAVRLVQLVVHDDNMHGQEAFWFAATARLFGATTDQIRAAATP